MSSFRPEMMESGAKAADRATSTDRLAEDRSNRRDFLLAGAALGAAAAGLARTVEAAPLHDRGPAPQTPFRTDPLERVRIAFVGVGGMGSAHVNNFLKMDHVDIVAVCDLLPERVERIQDLCVKDGRPKPNGYSRGERDFERLCETEALDLVFTATPWRWHVPVCVAAMVNGKHAATEVPASYTIDGCWELVEHAEKYLKHCVMMENCCYGRSEMMVLNMVRKGLLGEVLHGECGYLHDLRAVKFDMNGEGVWRRDHSITRNGNLYPTHGLGPIAQCMNINRGDQFDYLVSMSGPARGLNLYGAARFGIDDPSAHVVYSLGDVNTALIKTKLGKTIYLVHDTNLPRPYSRIHTVQGTKGIWTGYPDRIHVEGRTEGHGWDDPEKYREEFDHPLWRAEGENARGAGHGGMDYIEDWRMIQCLLKGEPMDMDVYDAAAWSVICEITEQSVANRSAPIDIPDFTRGRWRSWAPLGVVSP